MKYEEAFAELSELLKLIQEDKIGVDELADKVQRATELIKLCSDKLRATEQSIESVMKQLGL